MTIKRAYNISRDFNFRGFKTAPFKNQMFKFIIRKDGAHLIGEGNSYMTLRKVSIKNFEQILRNEKYDISKDNGFVMMDYGESCEVYSFNKPYTLTSAGLVTEEEFFLAEDIIEEQETIRKRDLIIGDRYLSISGKKYLYMGQMKYFYDEADFTLEINYLYDLKLNKFVQNDSVRLIEYIGENEEEVRINSMEVLPPSIFMYDDFRTKTKINNVSFTL